MPQRFQLSVTYMSPSNARIHCKGSYSDSNTDPTGVVYLKVKIFIPSDQNIPTQIEEFEKGDVVFLRGKFVACPGWKSRFRYNAIHWFGHYGFGIMTKTVRNVDGKSVLDFYVKEDLGDCDPMIRDYYSLIYHPYL
ncbi:hypothetical protein RhiirA4_426089 [Rhizophagus irregularis]|uniref:Uncharacterized protein n=1 Tax=Rhizophagus irregularis TaxID=588596 RepID=A0A2I1H3T1_9GLOM|nr:hypothetical protein RhiirA4_426089 [Rhizophagus irregularis]